MARPQLRTQVDTHTTLHVRPQMIVSGRVLQMSAAELETAIEAELQENPALERVDEGDEPSEDEILQALATLDRRRDRDDHEAIRSLPESEGFDWTDLAAAEECLGDHLMAQLEGKLPTNLWHAAEYAVGHLDDRGYLDLEPEQLALELSLGLDDAQSVLDALRSCEPAGIGAQGLRDALSLQVARFDHEDARVARVILRRYWDDFVAGRLDRIARGLKLQSGDVDAAKAFIRTLRPYPAEGFSTEYRPGRRAFASHAVADLRFFRSERGWQIETLHQGLPVLQVSRFYQARPGAIKRSRDERRHVRHFTERAERFLNAIQQRHETLRRIGEALLDLQSGFIQTGDYRFLKPLTRQAVADHLGVHESTISRATKGKFVQIENGEVVAFEVFFKPALRVQKIIEEMVAHEDPNQPLTDDQIADRLREQGIEVARRTVNKYRNKGRNLSSHARRSA